MKNFTKQESPSRSFQASKTRRHFGVLLLVLLLSLGFMQKQVYADVVGINPNSINNPPSSPVIQTYDETDWSSVSGPFTLTMTGFTVLGGNAVTWNSDDLLFYAIIRVSGGDRHLATVDPTTGICTNIGDMGGGFVSLTYNSDLGIMYAFSGFGDESLYSVDLTSGATTFLAGPFPLVDFGECIAYNYDDNLIYHWGGDPPVVGMETIDPVTFATTSIPQTGDSHAEISGAVYLGGGVFAATDFVFDSGPTNGYTITSGGVVTLLGATPMLVRGLAYVDAVLPVELSSFVSSINGNDVTLNWTTASETNNSGFDIERSAINGTWAAVGNVAGNGTSSNGHSYSFTDRGVSSGNYNYRLKQIDFNGNFEYFQLSNEVNVGIPNQFDLSQNYPNPFNPSTNINYDIPVDGKVNITVFDMSGKEVGTLVNEVKTAGYYTINFNASSLSSGIYFYKISLDANGQNFVSTKKMTLIK